MTTETERDDTPDIRPFEVLTQGDFHVQHVDMADRRPMFRRWYIGTEEKRPDGVAVYESWHEGKSLHVLLWNRTSDDGSVETIHYREGQTGATATLLGMNLPRTLPWRQWEVTVDTDKWGVEVMAWTSSWPNRPWNRIMTELYFMKLKWRARRDARRA